MTGAEEAGQLSLLRSTARRTRRATPRPSPVAAATRPVARVAVDVALPHLDRPFDYLVPEDLDAPAVPGARVRVRFAGRLVDGFVLDRVDASEHGGRLAYLQKVVSAEPVLGAALHGLAEDVAGHYAGTVADVLRLAIPPRHARTEAAPSPEPLPPPPRPVTAAWERYDHGRALLEAVHDGSAPRAVWTALPGPGWPGEVADLVVTALAAVRSGP